VVGGLMLSQLLTLYITPVLYIYLESFQKWAAGRLRMGGLASGGDATASPSMEQG
jgi:multidrug efflux pump